MNREKRRRERRGREGEGDGEIVRLEMFEELIRNEAMYMNVFQDVEYGKIRYAINFYDSLAEGEYWLSLPEVGIIVANHYKLAFVVLAKEWSALWLPSRHATPLVSEIRIVWLLLVNGNHFVRLLMRDNPPPPPTSRQWDAFVDEDSKEWTVTPWLFSLGGVNHNQIFRTDFQCNFGPLSGRI
ncbi:hypothetical protein Sjap_008711 [Stephania japonica]|uniref:Uncharacterized protein n=1 Tax=Stephania japonica TaxID=461633 RepID=A0AAP0JQ64_9MAGN